MRSAFLTLFTLLFSTLLISQQNPEDRLVRLIDAKSAETRFIDGKDYRVIKGPAQFLHNNALILCDSAIWDVTLNVVNAMGNVKIIHNQMTISSDIITYVADRSVAEVRGQLVELIDKESNKVRTHYLDYYTKDSLAMFYNGLSMLGNDSTYIESLNGFYYGKDDRFLFQTKVQMYSDSLLMKADSLEYQNRDSRVVFPGKTHAWQGKSYLTSRGGWLDREKEIYHFNKDVYIKTKDKEIWTDTLDYISKNKEAILKKNVLVLDTTNSTYVFADFVSYHEKPFRILLTKNPGGASYSEDEEGIKDTLFFAADTIIYFTLPLNEIDSSTVVFSKDRYELSKKDPLAEQYAPKPKGPPLPEGIPDKLIKNLPGKLSKSEPTPPAVKDTTVKVKIDSTLFLNDSLAVSPSKDTTSITFLLANKKVRFLKSDIRGVCDSLSFNSIDSLIRLFKNPIIWTEESQITSDSLQITISEKKMKKAEFTSSAFLIIPQDSTHYNQIKSTDIIAFFDKGKLSRFDALGGVTVLFYLEEDSVITALHEKEGKVYSAIFRDQKLEQGRLLESAQYNFYPIFEVKPEQEKLKGFRWLPEQKPKDRFDITDRILKPSQADLIEKIELPVFPLRETYFKELIKAGTVDVLPEKTDTVKPLPDIKR